MSMQKVVETALALCSFALAWAMIIYAIMVNDVLKAIVGLAILITVYLPFYTLLLVSEISHERLSTQESASQLSKQ